MTVSSGTWQLEAVRGYSRIKRNSAHIYVRISSILNEIYQPVQF